MSFRIISTGFDDLCICPVRSAGIIAYYLHSEKRETHSGFRVNFVLEKQGMLSVFINEWIGERHALACRYKNEIPLGSRHSARPTHFWPCTVQGTEVAAEVEKKACRTFD